MISQAEDITIIDFDYTIKVSNKQHVRIKGQLKTVQNVARQFGVNEKTIRR